MALSPSTLPTLAATLALLLLVQLLTRAATSALVRRFGWAAVPWTTGWLGVPVHEGAHALACLLTGRRIARIDWFAPDAGTGTMGSVTYESGRGPLAWLAGLAVGLAPLVGGTALLQGLAWSISGNAVIGRPDPELRALVGTGLDDLAAQATATFEQLAAATATNWRQGGWHRAGVLAGWYAAICVAAHLVPSRADLQGAWRGLLTLAVLGSATIALLEWRGIPTLATVERGVVLACAWLAPGLVLAAALLLALWLGAAVVGRLLPGRA